MRLVFLHEPVADADALLAAATFYRDGLSWDEAWREGDDTIAFQTPAGGPQIMVDISNQPAGPMYLVHDLATWTSEHQDLDVVVPRYEIPGGAVAGFAGPNGQPFFVFDQPDA